MEVDLREFRGHIKLDVYACLVTEIQMKLVFRILIHRA